MRYLGISPVKPKVAVFDFTGCEGCQLQLVNKEETLGPFLKSLDIVRFREASSAATFSERKALRLSITTGKNPVKGWARICRKTSMPSTLGSFRSSRMTLGV